LGKLGIRLRFFLPAKVRSPPLSAFLRRHQILTRDFYGRVAKFDKTITEPGARSTKTAPRVKLTSFTNLRAAREVDISTMVLNNSFSVFAACESIEHSAWAGASFVRC